ncbi:MAG TPA: hypothetical protein VD860_17060 [Azospirillum sp.]|nr:hypothetical protein [Azospirillum sp.]
MTVSADPNLDRVILVEAFPYDEDAADVVALYLATRDVVFPSDDADAPDREYDGRLASAYSRKLEMYAGGFIGGRSLPSYGAVRVVNDAVLVETGAYAAWRSYGWDGRRIRVLMWQPGTAYADALVLLDGVIQGVPEFSLTEISIPIADIQERLQQDIETATYAGTGGFEGGSDLNGKVKPFTAGVFRGMEPVPVDPANLWFDISPTTGLHSVTKVTDGGALLTASASNPPPSGSYYVDLVNGRIRTGSTPARVLRVDGRSAFGSNAQTAADIVKELLTDRLGFALAELDTASFTDLNTANSAVVGYVAKEAAPGLDCIDSLIGSVGGYYTGTRTGLFRVGRLEAPTATSEADAVIAAVFDDTDIERGSLTISPADKPPHRIEIGYARNWTPLTADAIAGSATAADRAFALEAYRVESDERAATLTKHLLSKPMRRDTLLDEQTAAAAEATRLVALISVPREMARPRLQTQPLALELGDEVWVQSDLYDIDAAYRVIGIDENASEGRAALVLWR